MFQRIVRLSIDNPVFVHLLFILVVSAGFVSAMSLPREEFPEISLDRVVVSIVFPGATADDVEELLTRPVEDSLEDVSDIDTFTSTASEGLSSTVITFLEGTDLQNARSEVEKAVASIDDLPEDAETPVVKEVILELPVVSVALLGDPSATLLADRIADELRDVDGVATVNVSGLGERIIAVELDQAKLRALSLAPGQIADAIASAKASIPAGTVERDGQDIFVKTKKRLLSSEDVAKIPIKPGSPLRIRDVAQVNEIVEPNDTVFWVDGRPAVKFTVGREETADPIDIRDAVQASLDEIRKEVPSELELRLAEDFTHTIRDRLDTVMLNAATGAALVLLVLLVMSGFRQAMLALIGMPVSYLMATWLMGQTGLTINVVSTFGLLIATGIIVDDAIVVIENVQRHLEMGKDRRQAVLDGTREVLLPVSVAVLTTIMAFLPLTMVSGTMGRIMKILPLAVVFCLAGSMFEAIFILPGHLNDYATKSAAGSRTDRLNQRLMRIYRPFVSWCVRHRYATLGLVTLAFGATMAAASTMPFQIGAPGKPFWLGTHVEVAPGLSRDHTKAEADKLDEIVRRHMGEDVRVASIRIGSVRDEETDILSTGANLGQLRWEFDVDDQLVAAYPAMVRELRMHLATEPDLARSAVKEPQAGPPTGAAVTARLRGRDVTELNDAMVAIKRELYGWDAVTDIRDSYGSGKETFRIDVDQDRAALYGLTEREVGQAVRTAVDGIVAAEVSIDEEPVDIIVRYAEGQRRSRGEFGDLVITNRLGKAVRLDQVAQVARTRDVGFIRREDGLRTVQVFADTDRDVLPPVEAADRLEEVWNERYASRFPGVELLFGGEADEFAKSLDDLPGAFALAILMIYGALALQFRSYVQPLIILSAVPFGLMGAVLGLFVMGYDLSLLALFGIVALAGIVVNDSLVMIDVINTRRAAGEEMNSAVLGGALQRLRPIVSTTLTTCLGLLPLAIGLGGKDEVLAPMAVSISAGLGIATLLVLLVVPALYLAFEDVRLIGERIFGRKKARPPTDDDVPTPPDGGIVVEDGDLEAPAGADETPPGQAPSPDA